MKILKISALVLFSGGLLSVFLYQFGDFDIKGSLFIGFTTALITYVLPQIELYFKQRKGKIVN